MRLVYCLFFGMFFCITAYAASFAISSPDFKNNSRIPIKYTCNGEDIPPTLRWENPPANTQSFLLMMFDPESSIGQTAYNWIVFNIPPTSLSLESGKKLPYGALAANNTYDFSGYAAPCPVNGREHRFIFTIYSLDIFLNLEPGSNVNNVLDAMEGHVLDQAQVIGKFSH